MRFRLAAVSAVAFALAALFCAGQARAAAEVHRFSLVLSAMPTSVAGGDFNTAIDTFNNTTITAAPISGDPLAKIGFTWAYDTELRYFVRPSFAITAGVSRMLASQDKEFMPAIQGGTDLYRMDITADVLTVPVHVGAAYYLQPYNQGDFQARAFIGGGLMQYAYTRATISREDAGGTAATANSFKYTMTQDSPGFYVEGGAHMFFASRWSVILSVVYRSGKLTNMQLDEAEINGQAQRLPLAPNSVIIEPNADGKPMSLDVGGAGVRLGVACGF